jgi:hypothetical protein
VHGRAGGGAIFDGIAGCDFTCAELARTALDAVEADILNQARNAMAADAVDTMITRDALNAVNGALDAEINAQAIAAGYAGVDAMLEADASAARRGVLDAYLTAEAAKVKAAGSASDAMQAAEKVANNTGRINAFDAAAASRELKQYLRANQQERALQLAAGMPVATQLNAYLKDNGDLRRLTNGSRFDQMTVDQRATAITNWLDAEMRNQQQGQGVNPRDPNEVNTAGMVENMSEAERVTWANKIAQEQARGTNP